MVFEVHVYSEHIGQWLHITVIIIIDMIYLLFDMIHDYNVNLNVIMLTREAVSLLVSFKVAVVA